MSGEDAGVARQPAPGRRIVDADRNRVVAMLQKAAGEGALDLVELDQRLSEVYAAKTSGQLAMVVHDLDLDRGPAQAPTRAPRERGRMWRSAGFRYHAGAYGLTNGFLVGTWALTTPGGFFWPFFPAAGWGIGLGMHAMAAAASVARGERRQDRRSHALHGHAAPAIAPPVAARTPPPPPPAPPAPARRFVAVLFTDIVGSTALTEAIGDAEWAHLRARHRELLTSCFTAHGGSEVGSAGDGFMARFDSPRSAAQSAVEIQRRLAQTRTEAGFAPQVRIGIHVGEAIEDEGDLLGSVINVAARITSEAEAGEILCSDPVADAIEGRFSLEDRGVRSLRGVNRPRHLLAISWS